MIKLKTYKKHHVGPQEMFHPTLKPRVKETCLRLRLMSLEVVLPFCLSFFDVLSDTNLLTSYYSNYTQDCYPFWLTFLFTLSPIISCFIWTNRLNKRYHIRGLENYASYVPALMSATPFRSFLIYCEDRTLHYQLTQGNLLPAYCRDSYRVLNIAHLISLNNLIEITLEATPQLLLQTYLLSENLFTGKSVAQQQAQMFSIVTALGAIAWGVRGQLTKAKHGRMSFISSLLVFAFILFQVISRVIACTVFTLAYKWVMFVVVGVHFICVFCLKYCFERIQKYRLMGTLASMLVYVAPQLDVFSQSHTERKTFLVHALYLILAAFENT